MVVLDWAVMEKDEWKSSDFGVAVCVFMSWLSVPIIKVDLLVR